MIKSMILILASLATVSAMAANSTCGSPTGKILITNEGYNGGAAPPEGMLQNKETIIINNKVVSENFTYFGEPPSDAPTSGPVESSYGASKSIETSGSLPVSQVRVEARKVTLSRKDGTRLLPNQKTLTDWVICRTTITLAP